MQFIYGTARIAKHFRAYGWDYLACFSLIATRSLDPALRRLARQMGRERARQWRKENAILPSRVGPHTIVNFVEASASADLLGERDGNLIADIRHAAGRFTPQHFLGFDPAREPPPSDMPQQCQCGARNTRGRKTCRNCKRRLVFQSRYQLWTKALCRGYRGDRSGVSLGTSYWNALAWLPEMRPYGGPGNGNREDFHHSAFAVTHLVYTLNDYGRYILSPRWLPCEFEFLKMSLNKAIMLDETEMVGEFLDSLKAFGLTERNALIRAGTEYLLESQNPGGSWGDPGADNIRERYHTTWTAVDGLRDYAWRGTRLIFPTLEPLLRDWATKAS